MSFFSSFISGSHLLFYHCPPFLSLVSLLFICLFIFYSHTWNKRTWEKETYSIFNLVLPLPFSECSFLPPSPFLPLPLSILNSSSPKGLRAIDRPWWLGVWPRLFGGCGKKRVTCFFTKKEKKIGLFLNVVLACFRKTLSRLCLIGSSAKCLNLDWSDSANMQLSVGRRGGEGKTNCESLSSMSFWYIWERSKGQVWLKGKW